MEQNLRNFLRQCIDGDYQINSELALAILKLDTADLPELFAASNAVRLRHKGHTVHLCSIINGKSGKCGENCKFCAQSAHYKGCADFYPLLSEERFLDAYDKAAELPISHYSIVTSGGALNGSDIDRICQTLQKRPNGKINWCGSFGCLESAELAKLKAAGLTRYHHNLETSRSFYPQICTTHDYQIRVDTVKRAKEAGLEVCSGGLLGLGESPEQRVEFAMELADLQVNEIPLNFLIPIPGTPLEHAQPMSPADILKTIAMFRLTNPRAGIRIAAGRVHMGHFQSMIFYAGCSAMMIGPLLTVAGGSPEDDLNMLKNLDLTILRADD